MSTSRINKLLEMLENEPADPFNIYAIALEYHKVDPVKAIHFYEMLLERHVDYLPAYYHAAALYSEMGFNEKAKKVYEKGMELAAAKNDAHTLQELKNAYNNHLYENG